MWQNLEVASPVLIGVFAALFGLVIGSFLNVCIVRIPEGKSIVMPASACPKCGAAIKPWDNIPVLSWLLLGGKCRGCKQPISWMYPVVELLTGALFLGCYLAFGLTIEALKWAIFSALLVVLVFTDMRERILPNVVNYSGFAAALLLSRQRCSHLTAELTLTSKRSAASCRDVPVSTASITRSRRS